LTVSDNAPMSANPGHFLNNRPAWVDLSSPDPEDSRNFYAELLGWDIQVSPDPQYGGYAMATDAGVGLAGIGAKMDPSAPTAWSLYIGTDDVAALAQRVTDNGGTVVMAPFDVGDQGKMAVFRDPAGAFFSAWQASAMRGFVSHQPGAFDWAELNARDVDSVLPFYEKVFGWVVKRGEPSNGQPPYNEFQLEGESILGAWEMNPNVPPEVPAYWQIYFSVGDVDVAVARALSLGATTVAGPQDMPGGRWAILADPQGAMFGVLRFEAPEG
jgi:predicted enzyme related to lactoylglutathione lyase